MNDVTDEQLMAFADGELVREERAYLQGLLDKSPDLRQRLAVFQATGKSLGRLFDGALRAPVPPHLERMVLAESAPPQVRSATANVVSLEARRAERDAPRWSKWRSSGLAHAATLVLGIALGALAFGMKSLSVGGPSDALVGGSNGDLRAQGALAKALDEVPSARVERLAMKDGQAVEMRIGLSFRSKDAYCRHYEFAGASAQLTSAGGTGVACRTPGSDWRLVVHWSERPKISAGGGTRPAGAEPRPAIAAAIGQLMVGDALGSDEEAAAIQKAWRR